MYKKSAQLLNELKDFLEQETSHKVHIISCFKFKKEEGVQRFCELEGQFHPKSVEEAVGPLYFFEREVVFLYYTPHIPPGYDPDSPTRFIGKVFHGLGSKKVELWMYGSPYLKGDPVTERLHAENSGFRKKLKELVEKHELNYIEEIISNETSR